MVRLLPRRRRESRGRRVRRLYRYVLLEVPEVRPLFLQAVPAQERIDILCVKMHEVFPNRRRHVATSPRFYGALIILFYAPRADRSLQLKFIDHNMRQTVAIGEKRAAFHRFAAATLVQHEYRSAGDWRARVGIVNVAFDVTPNEGLP